MFLNSQDGSVEILRFAQDDRVVLRLNVSTDQLKAIDTGSDAGGTEAVVDVNDGDVGSAGIEHAEEGSDAAKAGAVANAGGHRDDGDGDEAADHAGQSALHTGDADDDARFGKFGAMLQQSMNTGDADIVKMVCAITHHTSGEEGFFGNGNVAGAGGDDENGSLSGDGGIAFNCDGAGNGMEFGGAAGALHGGVDLRAGAGDQDVVARIFVAQHGADDFCDVLGSLAPAKYHFGIALAKSAVMIDFGKADIFKGHVLEAFDAGFGGNSSLPHGLQKFQNFFGVHKVWLQKILTPPRQSAYA